MQPGDKRWREWARHFGYFCCTIHILPLRIFNLSTALDNPTMQLRPEPMQTDTCVSAVEVFQGSFSYTLLHIFAFIYFLLEQERLQFKKRKCTSCSAKCLAETSISCTVGAAGKLVQFQWFPFSLVHGVLSKKCKGPVHYFSPITHIGGAGAALQKRGTCRLHWQSMHFK